MRVPDVSFRARFFLGAPPLGDSTLTRVEPLPVLRQKKIIIKVSSIDPDSPIPDSPPDAVASPAMATSAAASAAAAASKAGESKLPPFDGVAPPAPPQRRPQPTATAPKVFPAAVVDVSGAAAAAPAAPSSRVSSLAAALAPEPSTWFPAPKQPDSASAASPAAARAKALAGVAVARRVAEPLTPGAPPLPCRLPLYVDGSLLTDCAPLGGAPAPALSCFARGALGPQRCSQAAGSGAREALSDLLARGGPALGDGGQGALCSLPSMPQVAKATGCDAGLLCQPMEAGPLRGTRYGFCSGGGVAPGNAVAAPGGGGGGRKGRATEGTAAVRVARARKTADGRDCRLPLWLNGTLLTDCSDVGGVTSCFTSKSAKTAVECAAAQEDWSTVALSALLEAGKAGDGGRGAMCIVPLAANADPSSPLVPPRGGAAECDGGRVCVPTSAGPLVGTGVGYCAPRANMTMGSKIAAALGWGRDKPANGSTLASLAAVSPSANSSSATKGAPLPVAPSLLSSSGGGMLGSMLVAKRSSIGGAACRLPLVVPNRGSGSANANGNAATVLLDCRVGLGGLSEPACYTRGLVDIAPCAPVTPTAAASVSGNASSSSSSSSSATAKRAKSGAAEKTPIAELVALGQGVDGGPGSLCASPLSMSPGFDGARLPGPDVVPLCKAGLTCRDFQGAYGVCGPAPSPPPTAAAALLATGGEDTADASAASVAASAAAAAAAPRFPSLTAVRVSRRASVAGMQCRLPLRYKGRLLTDCDGALGGADGAPTGDKRCFVEGLNVTAICAPVPSATGAATESLDELEARGGLGDGRAGALCHLLPPTKLDSADASSSTSAAPGAVPPVASCVSGFACTQFASPPMAGGRFGWCKASSQQKLADAASGGLAAGATAVKAAKVILYFFLGFFESFVGLSWRGEKRGEKANQNDLTFYSFPITYEQAGLRRSPPPKLRGHALDGQPREAAGAPRDSRDERQRDLSLPPARRLWHAGAAGGRREPGQQLLLRPALHGRLLHRDHADGRADELGVRVSVLRREQEGRRRAAWLDVFCSCSAAAAAAAAAPAAEAGERPRFFLPPSRRAVAAPDEVREVRGRPRGAAAAAAAATPRLGNDDALERRRGGDQPLRLLLPRAAPCGLGAARASAASPGCGVAGARRALI